MGRGFDNNRIAAPTHFEVVNTWSGAESQCISQTIPSRFCKNRMEGLSLRHGHLIGTRQYQTRLSWFHHVPSKLAFHLPVNMIGGVSNRAGSKPFCFVISGFHGPCLMPQLRLTSNISQRRKCWTCDFSKLDPLRTAWGRLLRADAAEMNVRMWSDHPPGHEAVDQTYQMEGKQERKKTVYIKQN